MRPRLLSAGTCASIALLGTAVPAVAQDGRPVAFVNARILTISGEPIEKGTLLVRNGVIAELGPDVEVPAGTKEIDASGKTLMPGLVSAWSQAGIDRPSRGGRRPQRGGFRGRPRSSGRGATNQASAKVVDQLYARQDVFGELLEVGITSLALAPTGNGLPGTAAILRPDGVDAQSLVADDSAFLVIGMNRDAGTKKLLKESFDKATAAVKERNKPKEAPKPKDGEGDQAKKEGDGGEKPEEKKPGGDQPKPDEPKPDQPKPDQPKPDEPKPDEPKPDDKPKPAKRGQGERPAAAAKEKPKDPNIEVLADLLQKNQRGFLLLSSAADLVHYRDAVGDELTFPTTVVATRIDGNSGHFDQVLEPLKALGGAVLMPPSMSTVPRTAYAKNPAAELHAAGISVGFVLGDNPGTVRGLFFRLMELVRHGLPADAALAGVTAVPAKALGIDGSVGTLEVGKRANLLVFDGDPLDPLGKLESVWIGGRLVDGAKQ